MGCWTESCSFTGLPIEEGEPVYHVEVAEKPLSYFGARDLAMVMRDYVNRKKDLDQLKADTLP